MDFQEEFNKAWNLKKEGKRNEAFIIYESILTVLYKEAGDFGHRSPGAFIDEGNTRKMTPTYFIKTKEYLTRDNLVCTVLNNMGVILAEKGNIAGAKNMFEQSIELTPPGFKYQDPKTGLANLQ